MTCLQPSSAIRRLALLVGLLTVTGSALAAGPIYWDWPASRDFNELDLQGTALNARGEVVPGLAHTAIPLEGAEVVWRVVSDGGDGYYLGTGHGGEIHWTDGRGETRLHAKVEGNEVFSLLARPDGGLLAGCGPEGHVYAVAADGAVSPVGQVAGGYVWSMQAGAGQEVWLATGSPAALYRWRPDAGLEHVQTFPALNALDVAVDRDGTLVVVTQGPGLVYRVPSDGEGTPQLLFEAVQDEVRQIIPGPDGVLHVLALHTGGDMVDLSPGTAQGGNGSSMEDLVALFGDKPAAPVDKGALYRLDGAGQVVPVWAGHDDLMIVTWDPTLGWLAGGSLDGDQSRLLKLTPPFGSHPLSGWQGGDVLDLLVATSGPAKGDVLVAQAHPGAVSRLSPGHDAPQTALSPPLDGLQPVKWGRLSWRGDLPDGQLKWSVRGGNRAVPDATWTDWSDSWTGRDQVLDLPDSRYLQWRVTFPRSGSGGRLTAVSVSAWQENLPPVIRQFNVEQVTAVNRGGLLNHGDNITQTFSSGLKAEFSRTTQIDRRAAPSRAAVTRPVRVFTWQGADPNADRLTYSLAYRQVGAAAWRVILPETQELIGSWNTAEVADGLYELRLTASDLADNPGARAHTVDRVTPPLRVDNTPPEISGFKVTRTETGLRVRFKAKDAVSQLSAASLTLPDGTVQRLDPVDLICDSPEEKFDTELTWPVPGAAVGPEPWQLRVEVGDMTGNLAVAEGDAR